MSTAEAREALEGAIEALKDTAATLADVVASLEPVEPPDPVEPPPPPSTDRPEAIFRELDSVPTLHFGWGSKTRYARSYDDLIAPDGVLKYRVESRVLSAGRRQPMPGTYWVELNGERVADLPVIATEWGDKLEGEVILPAPHGWHLIEVGTDNGEQTIPSLVFIDRGEGEPDYLPIVPISQEDFVKEHPYIIQWVPNTFQPVANPLAHAPSGPYDGIPDASELWREIIVPEDQSRYYPVYTDEGVKTAAADQMYYTGVVTNDMPQWPLLDGPRGVGNLMPAMHIEYGTAMCPETGRVGILYVQESHRVVKIRPDGEIKTLFGWRSKPEHMSAPDAKPVYDLIGDWQMPDDRKGMAHGWGISWDSRTLRTNFDAPRIASERGLNPHFDPDGDGYGPTMYVTDDLHGGRILKAEGGSHSHDTPFRVTEWSKQSRNYWDIAEHPDQDGRQISTVQEDAEIVILDENGNEIDVFVKGEKLANVHPENRIVSTPYRDMDFLRRPDCVAPQGLFVVGRWVYWGDSIQRQLKRRHIDTGETVTVIKDGPVARSYSYYKFAIGHGIIALQVWDNKNGGAPFFYDMDGNPIDLGKFSGNGLMRGRGPWWEGAGYGSAVGIDPREFRIAYNSVWGGLNELRLAQPDDPDYDRRKYQDGKDQMKNKGYLERFGRGGWGNWWGEPLPWGESDDIDYYLEACDHKWQT